MSPPLGLHVVDVDVVALLGVGDNASDVLAVLDDGVALLEVLQRHLVADRNVVIGLGLGRRIGLGDDAHHLGAALQALDDDDAHVVLWAVHEELRNLGQVFPLSGLVREVYCGNTTQSAAVCKAPGKAVEGARDWPPHVRIATYHGSIRTGPEV